MSGTSHTVNTSIAQTHNTYNHITTHTKSYILSCPSVSQAVHTANEAKELQAETSRLVAAGKPGDAANDAAAKSAYVYLGSATHRVKQPINHPP